MTEPAEPRQVDVDRAEQQLIGQAAARLRHEAIVAAYGGAPAKHLAFSLALVLDELGRHVRGLHAEVRRQAVASARALLEATPGAVVIDDPVSPDVGPLGLLDHPPSD